MFAKLKSYCCQVKQQSIKLTLFRWQLLGTATREGSTTGLSKTPGQHGKKPGHECWAKQTNKTIGRFGENGYFKIKRGTGHCGVSIFFTNTLALQLALISNKTSIKNLCILHLFVHNIRMTDIASGWLTSLHLCLLCCLKHSTNELQSSSLTINTKPQVSPSIKLLFGNGKFTYLWVI